MNERKEERVFWVDGNGNERESAIIAKYSHRMADLTRSWVAVWDEQRFEPRWIDLRDCNRFENVTIIPNDGIFHRKL